MDSHCKKRMPLSRRSDIQILSKVYELYLSIKNRLSGAVSKAPFWEIALELRPRSSRAIVSVAGMKD